MPGEPAYTFPPFDVAGLPRLIGELGVSRPMAEVLARRGLGDPDAARAFLALDGPQHPPDGLGDIEPAARLIATAVQEGRRIVVHGDYDCDGVSATALLVTVLEELGGSVEAFLPSRFEDGYGLAVETVERLAEQGAELLITVDCGITAVESVARARALGLDVVVSDHHRPGLELPDCLLVAPRTGDPERDRYPFAELCGTGVAYKLATAVAERLGASSEVADRHLDLVALATVADLVPLLGENRGLVRAGLREIARGGRIGLVALCDVASVDRTRIDAGALGFRLGPRLNAAGRLAHPDAAYRLLRASDRREALELARRLDELSRERQAIEARILAEALEQAAELPPALRNAPGVVLASDRWHAGVIGIVASRVVERLGKPAVLIAIDGTTGTGSGRSLPAFDLHAGLEACCASLERWGGHRQAAGLTLAVDRIPDFQQAFAAHCDEVLTGDELRPRPRVDVVLGVADVSLDLADEFGRLGPFGLGNASISVLVPGARLGAVEPLGAAKAHLRLSVEARGASCRTLWWRAGGERDRLLEAGSVDVLCSIERNDYNGSSSVQLVAKAVEALPPRGVVSGCAERCDASCQARRLPGTEITAGSTPAPVEEVRLAASERRCERVRDGVATAVGLLAAGERVLVLVGDVSARRELLMETLAPARLGIDGLVLASRRCERTELRGRLRGLAEEGAALVLADWESARSDHLERAYRHVIALDPPTTPDERALLEHADCGYAAWSTARGGGEELLTSEDPKRIARAIWRAVGGGGATLPALGERTGALPHPPSAGDLERALRILVDAGMVVTDGTLYARAPEPPRIAFEQLADGARWVGEHAARISFAGGADVAVTRR